MFYFYFDTLDATKSKVTCHGLAASLLAAIGTHSDYDQSILRNLYEKYQKGSERVPQEVMKTAIFKILCNFTGKTYIILDAMDECQEQTKVIQIIQALFELGCRVSVLVTSRHPISFQFDSRKLIRMSHNVEEMSDDIITCIDQAIKENPIQFRGLEDEIKETLIEGAHEQ